MLSRGVVYMHSAPLAVVPHVEWAIARVLAAPIRLEWTAQPVEANARRAEYTWSGRTGTGVGQERADVDLSVGTFCRVGDPAAIR